MVLTLLEVSFLVDLLSLHTLMSLSCLCMLPSPFFTFTVASFRNVALADPNFTMVVGYITMPPLYIYLFLMGLQTSQWVHGMLM